MSSRVPGATSHATRIVAVVLVGAALLAFAPGARADGAVGLSAGSHDVAYGDAATASPSTSAAAIGVTTDRITVYEGQSATITLAGPGTIECDEWIGQSYFQTVANFVGSLEDWNGRVTWTWADLTYWIQDDTADTTVYFRCYDWAYGSHGGPDMATLETPFAAGVTIVFRAAGVTPPVPPATATAGGTSSRGTAMALFLAGLAGVLSLAFLRRVTSAGRRI